MEGVRVKDVFVMTKVRKDVLMKGDIFFWLIGTGMEIVEKAVVLINKGINEVNLEVKVVENLENV